MRTSTAKASLMLAGTLMIAGCSTAGTTEDQPGAAGDSSTAAATPSPSSTPGPTESENGVTTTEIPSIEVVSQQTKVSKELRSKLKSTPAQFNYKDYSLTLVPVEGNVETGSVRFAVDSNLPPSCMEFENGGDGHTCATLVFIGTTSSEATNGRDVITQTPFFNLDKDVGKSVLKVNIPPGASKAFALVSVGDKTSTINVETGETTKRFGVKLPWAAPSPD